MDRLRELRYEAGKTMRQTAEEIGIPYTTYVSYEKGAREPNSEMLVKIAEYYCTTVDYLLGRSNRAHTYDCEGMPSNIISTPQMRRVPLVGAIACGTPTLAEQNIEGCVDMPEHIRADFALRCKGDSMINARIYDGDIVYIRQQEEVEHGEIAAVLIDDAATLKRVYLYTDHISLEAENPQYRPLVYWGEAMNGIRILGKAIAFTSAVR